MFRIGIIFVAALSFFVPAASRASNPTRYPSISLVYPVAVRKGQKSRVSINVEGDISTAYKVLLEGTEIRGTVLPRIKNQLSQTCQVELEIDAGARIGPREIRLATKEAITTPATIYISDVPVMPEPIAPNDSRQRAMDVTLPFVANGRIDREVDQDWYRFYAKEGQQVAFTVFGLRLHDTIHKLGRFIDHFDSMLTLIDANGRELASNDDFYFADPLLSAKIPKDGLYYVKVAQYGYRGNPFYTYALMGNIGFWPTRSSVFSIVPGNPTDVKLFGPGSEKGIDGKLFLPQDTQDGELCWVEPQTALGMMTPIRVLASNITPIREDFHNSKLETPQPIQCPAVIEGTLSEKGRTDFYSVDAKKGDRFEFEVFSRRLFSKMDAEIYVLNVKGNRLATAEDATLITYEKTADPYLEWTAPSDGKFILAIRDLLRRGGKEFTYCLRMRKNQPDFVLTTDPSLCMIGPGSRCPIYVRAMKKMGFDVPIELSIRNLPAGVTASKASIEPSMRDGCIVLTASVDAKVDASTIIVEGSALLKPEDSASKIVRRATPLAEIYQAQRRPCRTFGVAVTVPSDISVDSTVQRIALRPGESARIPIVIKRAKKYEDGPITLSADWRFENKVFGTALPEGVTIDGRQSKLALNGKSTEGFVTLTASPNALPKQHVYTTVLALVPIEFSVSVPYCTAPIEVTILPKSKN